MPRSSAKPGPGQGSVRMAWTWVSVFGIRAAIRHAWSGLRLRRRATRQRRPPPQRRRLSRATSVRSPRIGSGRHLPLAIAAVGVAGIIASVSGYMRAGTEVARDDPVSGATRPILPILPPMETRFDGAPLTAHLRPPEVTAADWEALRADALLASTVLDDAEFARAVHWWVRYWAVSATAWFPGFLTRMESGGTAVDSALAMRGFPPSLRYLPLIESGYDPRVTSRAGAVGLWQLMPSTARDLGLEVGPGVDERRHPEKSTAVALRYLDSLHTEFGSWFLTLAAYNSGPGRVRSILRRHAPGEPRTDSLFWALRDRFPAETREFVPKLVGAMWVASRPEAYGYRLP